LHNLFTHDWAGNRESSWSYYPRDYYPPEIGRLRLEMSQVHLSKVHVLWSQVQLL